MLAHVLTVMLAQAAPVATLAMPALALVEVDPKLGDFWAEHLSQQLKLRGVKTYTQREIATLLGIERQRELLGCTDESSNCSLEIANALGTEGILVGDVAKTSSGLQLNLKVLSAKSGRTLAVYSDRATQDEMVDSLSVAARELAATFAHELKVTLVPLKREDTVARSLQRRWWAVGAVGAAAAVAAAVMFVLSNQVSAQLRGATSAAPLSATDAVTLRDRGQAYQTTGAALTAVAATGLAVSAVLLVFDRREARREVVMVPLAGGAAIAFGGSF